MDRPERICLDYDTAMDFLRGDPGTIEKLKYYADKEEMCITAFTMVYLFESIRKPEVASMFVNSVKVLPFDRQAAAVAARLMGDLKEKGELDRHMDSVLTAAICMANDAWLFTRNQSRYERMKGSKLRMV